MLSLTEVLKKLRQRKAKYEALLEKDRESGAETFNGSVARHKVAELDYVLSLLKMEGQSGA